MLGLECWLVCSIESTFRLDSKLQYKSCVLLLACTRLYNYCYFCIRKMKIPSILWVYLIQTHLGLTSGVIHVNNFCRLVSQFLLRVFTCRWLTFYLVIFCFYNHTYYEVQKGWYLITNLLPSRKIYILVCRQQLLCATF